MNNNKKIIIIISIIAIIAICIFGYFKFIKSGNDQNNNDFLMIIEDTYSFSGRGAVAEGIIKRGTISTNDTVKIKVSNQEIKTTVVTGIVDSNKKTINSGSTGDKVGLILKNIERSEIERGQIVTKSDSTSNVTYVTEFSAQVYFLSKEEGGRSTPISNNYKPYFYFGNNSVLGTVTLPSDKEVSTGSTVNVKIKLEKPVFLEKGTEFEIKEGSKTVGKGKVTGIN